MSYCCNDFYEFVNNNEFVKEDAVYGTLLVFKDLIKKDNYYKIHRYGVQINYCPMCGSKLRAD